jgi:hypothetical protein
VFVDPDSRRGGGARTAEHRTDGRAGERSGHHQAHDEARCGAAEDAGDGGERLSIDG